MKLSKAGIDLIKAHEGYHERLSDGSCRAYLCPAGVWTIGYGSTTGVVEGMTWTREQAELGLRNDVARFEAGVLKAATVPLTQGQFDALVSFAYNVGLGALERSTLLRKLNAGDAAGAAAEFAKWTKAAGRVMPGLVRRRADEAALFLSESAPELMPQNVEPTLPAAPVTKSGTVWGTITGAVAAAGAYAETWISGLIEWAAKLTELGPAQAALAQAGGNVKAIMLGLGAGAAVYVISRRVKASQEGKSG